jgi:hypothetical protein
LSGRNIKLGLATGVAGLSLLAGGLLFGGTLVSAQEPTPTPGATEPAAPGTTPSTPQDRAPSDDGTPRSKAECDKDGDGQPDAEGDSTGIRFRGGARSLAQ